MEHVVVVTERKQLPHNVQDPHGPLCYETLLWKDDIRKFNGKNPLTVKVAHILSARANEFVTQEGHNLLAPTTFHVANTKKCEVGSLIKPHTQSSLRVIWYQCGYGPDDFRSIHRVDRRYKPKAGSDNRSNSGEGGPSRKRGCVCSFAIKQLYLWPDVAEIIYYHVGHVDCQGKPCHGFLDESAQKQEVQEAPWMPQSTIDWVLQRLADKYTPQQIIEIHLKELKAKAVENGELAAVQGDSSNKRDVLPTQEPTPQCLSDRLASDIAKLLELVGDDPILQTHALSLILKAQGQLMELKARMQEVQHHSGPLIPLMGTNSKKRLKAPSETVLAKNLRKKQIDAISS